MKVKRRGREIDLSYEHKTACPKCRSKGNDRAGDNFHVYGLDTEDKYLGGHCFACGYTIPSQELVESGEEQIEEEDEDIMGREFNAEVREKVKEVTTMNSGGYRGITEETSKVFRVRYQYSQEDGTVSHTLYPCTKDYNLVGYKVRAHPKDFKNPGPMGETGKSCDLFGQFAFKKASGKYVIVTSGEADSMAAYQMLADYRKSRGQQDYDQIPCVSPTNGEASAHRQLQLHYEWLNRFERIIYVKDPDAAGDAAVEKIAKVLPKHKLYVMELSTVKDPNEALEKGKQREFISKFFSATKYVPSGIVGSGVLMDKIKQSVLIPKIPLPPFMHDMQKLMAGGIPLGTITCIASASGSGKSTYVDEMLYYWVFNSPHKVGVVSLESDCAQYGTKILSRHLQKKIDLIEDAGDKMAFLEDEAVSAKASELFLREDGEHRFHLIDERDGSLDSLKELIMQLIIECDVKVVILDPLTDILDGLSNDEQSVFMKWMKGMVKSHSVSFILVSHLRKSAGGGKANSRGADVHEEDFHGSSSIFKSSACNVLFMRDKEHPNEYMRNVTTIKMTKCRWTGRTAPVAGKYYYDIETHTLYDLEDYIRENPEMACKFEEDEYE